MKLGGKVQRSEAQRFLAGVLSTQVSFPRGQQRPEGDKGALKRQSLFSPCVSGKEDGLGPLHGVLNGQGNKNLVCREEAGTGWTRIPSVPREQVSLREVSREHGGHLLGSP